MYEPGTRVELLRRGRVLASGTVVSWINANDDMTWGHKMRPEWHFTVDLHGLGLRKFRDCVGVAKDTRRWGRVQVREET